MANVFPKNCSSTCPYYRSWDLSIDDYTNLCTKLGVQIDDCDAGTMALPLCPLENDKEENKAIIKSKTRSELDNE